jgi:nicotinamidase-related amidase
VPVRSPSLHGNVPEKSRVALLLIDVINDLEFEGGAALAKHSLPMARRLAALKRRAREAGIPVIYANDNFGKWRSDFRKLIAHCLEDGVRGERMAKLLKPGEEDYFVLKPRHSIFYATTLGILLEHLGARTLILTGVAGNICILFSASDAYVRGFELVVPSDCVASEDPEENRRALRQIKSVLKGTVLPSARLDVRALRRLKRSSPRTAAGKS